MQASRSLGLCGLFATLAASKAHAYFGPPSIAPSNPDATQTLTLSVPWGGGCDLIGQSISDPNQGVPQVTVNGSDIDVLFYGAQILDIEWCVAPEAGVADLSIGPFAAGTYDVHVRMWHHDGSYPEVLAIGDLTIAVGGAPAPVELPVTPFAGLLLSGLLLGYGLIALQGRRSASN
jgi:hypothetical protein